MNRKKQYQLQRKKRHSDKKIKGASLLGTTLVASSSMFPAIDGMQLVKATELEENKSKFEDVQESDKLPDIENDGVTQETVEVTESTETEALEETAQQEETPDTTESSQEVVEESELSVSDEQTKEINIAPAMRSFSLPATGSGLTQEAFIQTIGAQAQLVAAQNDLYASIMIAQAILESAWGTSMLSSPPNHNLFGIKGSYQGQSVTMPTWEHINGQDVTINAAFRKYPSYSESLQDNAYVLKNTSFVSGVYFYSGAWKSNTSSYRDATSWLTGRYATDPNYGSKLNNLIERYNLTAYDTGGTGGSGSTGGDQSSGNSNNNVGNGNSSNGNTGSVINGTTYTVKSGDTLYSIGLKYGATVSQLKSWNKLSSDMIYVGQKLIVSANGGNQSTNNNSNSNSDSNSSNGNDTSSAAKTYTVKAGDTLSSIGLKHGVTIAQLKTWNKLSSDMIYVGQTLKVSSGTTSGTNNTGNGSGNQSNTNATTYAVKAGDTLYGIASKNGVTVAQLKSWNKLSNDMIYVGQILKIGSGATSGSSNPGTNTGNQSSTNNATYTVKAGDTLSGIAAKYGVTIAQLKTWNKLSSDIIYVGQKLNVGASSGNTNNSGGSNNPSNTSTTKYTVKAGDTLSGIGSKYGVTVGQLKSWNNLKNDVIYVGQVLSLQTSGSSSSNQSGNAQSTSTSHTVKTGETLYGISLNYGVTVAQLKSWNSLKGDTIFVGQKLSVKSASVGSSSSNSKINTNPSSSVKSYTVKAGDTLSSIGTRYGVSISQLKSWNGLKSDVIYVGQKLKLTISNGNSGSTTTETSQSAGTQTTSTYVVKVGDTLYSIANKFGMSVSQLQNINGLRNHIIHADQKLKIVQSTGSSNTSTSAKYYTVKDGDSLWKISNDHSVSVAQIKSWNTLKSDLLYVGQSLRVK